MSFVRIGKFFFRPSKVVAVDVASAGLFGKNYTLRVVYDIPHRGNNYEPDDAPTKNFHVYYEKNRLKQLVEDLQSIVSENGDCLLGKGARTLLGHNNNNRE